MHFPSNLICIDIETTDSDNKIGSMIQLSAIIVIKSLNLYMLENLTCISNHLIVTETQKRWPLT